jgi:predicted RNA-binding protein with RPS1 domain
MSWGEDIRVQFPDWGTDVALSRWPSIRARLRVGQTVRGIVIARAPFGVWLDIRADHPALLLVPEMRGATEHRITFDEYPEVGEVLEARIVALGDRAEISLSQHPGKAEGSAEPGAPHERSAI